MDATDRVWRERGLREAVLAGDEDAWRLWYEESFARLDAYAVWRCGGRRDHADELVQEVWLTAVKRLVSFDPTQGSFVGWLRGIAAQLARNYFRREQRRVFQPLSLREVEDGAIETARREEQSEQVARALTQLPDHYEAVLRAKYLDGLDVAAIAVARQTTAKAVESLLSRAREAFREAYAREEQG